MFLPADLWVIFQRGWEEGVRGIQNVFGPAAQGTSTEQKNVERGQEGWGNTRKHEWNSFHQLWCAGLWYEATRTDVFYLPA